MRVHARTSAILVAAVLGLAAPAAIAQNSNQSEGSNGISARRVGTQGQRVRMPGMANPGRTLPIHRQSNVPGFTNTQPSLGVPNSGVNFPGPVPVRGVVTEGTYLNGSYDGGNLALQFHLGSGATLLPDGTVLYPRTAHTTRYLLQNGRYGDGYYWYDPYWYYDSGRYWSTRPIDGVLTRQVDPTLLVRPQPTPQPAAAPVPELTSLEKAHKYLADDEAEKAIEAFRDHLKEDPEDMDAVRGLGLAMLDAGRMSDGTALIALAYHTDALLARTPVDLDELGLGARRYDRLLTRVLGYAKRTDANAAHLAGVLLLQAEGKVAGATRVLDRAERAGLEEDVVDAFRRELGTPAHQ